MTAPAFGPALQTGFDALTPFEAATARPVPDRRRELFLALPKGGKTLGGSDEKFLAKAGLISADKMPRVDDYRLEGLDDDTGVRVFELKPGDALDNIADGLIDAAIVGMDVMKEFNKSSRGQKGRLQIVPIANLDLAPCALAVAVRESDPAQTVRDLNGRTIVTKYTTAVEDWARKNNVKPERIVKRNGGIESYSVLMPGAVIADMVESGASLVANDWRILGMQDTMWANIRDGVSKFSDLSAATMQSIPGVVIASRAMLVRGSRKMNPRKEIALAGIAARFVDAAAQLGRRPQSLQNNVAQQKDYPAGRRITRASDTGGEIGHAFRNRM